MGTEQKPNAVERALMDVAAGGHRRKGCEMYAPTKEWSDILRMVGK